MGSEAKYNEYEGGKYYTHLEEDNRGIQNNMSLTVGAV